MSESLYVSNVKISLKDSDYAAVMDTKTEDELVERAKSDPRAFSELYELYYSRILNYMYRRILDVRIAEELTSNTFFNVLKALPEYRQKTSFRAWIYRIATNEIKMYWRSIKNRLKRENDFYETVQRDRVYFSSPDIEIEEEQEEYMRLFAQLYKSLDFLPERYRSVLVLRYFESLSYNEIAQVLGKRVGTVKSLVHRGLKRLRVLMENQNATFS